MLNVRLCVTCRNESVTDSEWAKQTCKELYVNIIDKRNSRCICKVDALIGAKGKT